MKTKLFSKARIISAVLVLFAVGLLAGFAEVAEADGCPDDTGGFASRGIRIKKECVETRTETGYWWFIKGEVKWVGTVFAGMGGEFQKDERIVKFTGQEYTCTGDDKICWVCNCYYSNSSTTIE